MMTMMLASARGVYWIFDNISFGVCVSYLWAVHRLANLAISCSMITFLDWWIDDAVAAFLVEVASLCIKSLHVKLRMNVYLCSFASVCEVSSSESCVSSDTHTHTHTYRDDSYFVYFLPRCFFFHLSLSLSRSLSVIETIYTSIGFLYYKKYFFLLKSIILYYERDKSTFDWCGEIALSFSGIAIVVSWSRNKFDKFTKFHYG